MKREKEEERKKKQQFVYSLLSISSVYTSIKTSFMHVLFSLNANPFHLRAGYYHSSLHCQTASRSSRTSVVCMHTEKDDRGGFGVAVGESNFIISFFFCDSIPADTAELIGGKLWIL